MTKSLKPDWLLLVLALIIGFQAGFAGALCLYRADRDRIHQIVLDQTEELEDIISERAK